MSALFDLDGLLLGHPMTGGDDGLFAVSASVSDNSIARRHAAISSILLSKPHPHYVGVWNDG